MFDEPPVETPPPPAVEQVAAVDTASDAPVSLPVEERADGSLLIDLTPLAPKPQAQECLDSDPNPLDDGIVVCRELTTDQRLGPQYGPTDEVVFASAIPRAKVRLSEEATAEANAINKGVGGFNANGGEVRVKIGF